MQELLGRVPILGICLGHQLLAQAAGFETFKLPFGHRGANHPVLELAAGRVLVTCQNHGFAVRGDGPAVTHVSLYDGTVEGLALPDERARSLQFHPEAGPGPHDAWAEIEAWRGDRLAIHLGDGRRAGRRECGVLGRARIARYDAPCVLASHRPAHPDQARPPMSAPT